MGLLVYNFIRLRWRTGYRAVSDAPARLFGPLEDQLRLFDTRRGDDLRLIANDLVGVGRVATLFAQVWLKGVERRALYQHSVVLSGPDGDHVPDVRLREAFLDVYGPSMAERISALYQELAVKEVEEHGDALSRLFIGEEGLLGAAVAQGGRGASGGQGEALVTLAHLASGHADPPSPTSSPGAHALPPEEAPPLRRSVILRAQVLVEGAAQPHRAPPPPAPSGGEGPAAQVDGDVDVAPPVALEASGPVGREDPPGHDVPAPRPTPLQALSIPEAVDDDQTEHLDHEAMLAIRREAMGLDDDDDEPPDTQELPLELCATQELPPELCATQELPPELFATQAARLPGPAPRAPQGLPASAETLPERTEEDDQEPTAWISLDDDAPTPPRPADPSVAQPPPRPNRVTMVEPRVQGGGRRVRKRWLVPALVLAALLAVAAVVWVRRGTPPAAPVAPTGTRRTVPAPVEGPASAPEEPPQPVAEASPAPQPEPAPPERPETKAPQASQPARVSVLPDPAPPSEAAPSPLEPLAASGCVDEDGDGYLRCAGGASPPDGRGEDCDDQDPSTYPGATERLADGIDQDCDRQDVCYRMYDGVTSGYSWDTLWVPITAGPCGVRGATVHDREGRVHDVIVTDKSEWQGGLRGDGKDTPSPGFTLHVVEKQGTCDRLRVSVSVAGHSDFAFDVEPGRADPVEFKCYIRTDLAKSDPSGFKRCLLASGSAAVLPHDAVYTTGGVQIVARCVRSDLGEPFRVATDRQRWTAWSAPLPTPSGLDGLD